MIKVKIYLKNHIRRFSIKNDSTYKELISTLSQIHPNLKENPTFMYQDDEGDWISFSSQIEWQETLSFAKTSSLLKIKLRVKQPEKEKKETKKIEKKGAKKVEKKNLHGRCHWKNRSPNKIGPNDQVVDVTHLFKDVLGNIGIETSDVSQSDVVHYGIVCDGCEEKDFKGIRYKCKQCSDFDFCSKCYEKSRKLHFDGGHEFNEMKVTIRNLPYSNVITHFVYEEDDKKKDVKTDEKKKEIKKDEKKKGAKKDEKKEIKKDEKKKEIKKDDKKKDVKKEEKKLKKQVKKELKKEKDEEKKIKKELKKEAKKIKKDEKKSMRVKKQGKKEKVVESKDELKTNEKKVEQTLIKNDIPKVEPKKTKEIFVKEEVSVPKVEEVKEVVKKDEKYSIHYEVLESMGFKDTKLSHELLEKYKGNLQRVVDEYLSLIK